MSQNQIKQLVYSQQLQHYQQIEQVNAKNEKNFENIENSQDYKIISTQIKLQNGHENDNRLNKEITQKKNQKEFTLERSQLLLQIDINRQSLQPQLIKRQKKQQNIQLIEQRCSKKEEISSKQNSNNSQENDANQDDQNYKKNQQQAKKYFKQQQLQKQKQQENQRKGIEQIIKTAEQQRVSITYQSFLKYYQRYHAIYEGNKSLIQNILTQLQNKRKLKIVPSYMIKQYLNQQSNLLHNFYQKCYSQKLISQNFIGQKQNDKNSMINMKQQLLKGFQQLINLKKSLGNSMNRVNQKIKNHTIKQIEKAFQQFQCSYKDSYKIVQQLKQNFDSHYKQFVKRTGFCKIVFSEIMGGKFNQANDIFLELAGFIQIDRFIKYSLNQYGKGVIDLIKKITKADILLFEQIQSSLESYQEYTSKNHIKIPLRLKNSNIDFKRQIYKLMQYEHLCASKDIAYIHNLQESIFCSENNKNRELIDKDFQKILNIDWVTVVKVYGHADQMIRGTLLKDFQLESPQKVLVFTVCNNLIEFNKLTFSCDNKMIFKNLFFMDIKQKTVKLEEKTKKLIFDSTKKWNFEFCNENIAEEFVVYLQNIN